MSEITMWEIENEAFAEGYQIVCGVDEAGRGPLAGPVCAAAVILPPNVNIPGLNDSKKLSDKKRRELMPVIKETALAYGIAFADSGTDSADAHTQTGTDCLRGHDNSFIHN